MKIRKKYTGDDFWGSVEVKVEGISLSADTDSIFYIAGHEISRDGLKIFTEMLLAILEHGMEGLIDYGDEE